MFIVDTIGIITEVPNLNKGVHWVGNVTFRKQPGTILKFKMCALLSGPKAGDAIEQWWLFVIFVAWDFSVDPDFSILMFSTPTLS